MRIDLKKMLFIGSKKNIDIFFQEAQNLGVIHFIDPKTTPKEVSEEIKNIVAAIKILRSYPPTEQDETLDFSKTAKIVEDTLKWQQALLQQEEQIRIHQLEIERVAGFGNFSMADLRYIEEKGHKVIQFFSAKEGMKDSLELPESLLFISTYNGLDHFMSINTHKVHYDNFSEVLLEKNAEQLKSEVAAIKDKKEHYDNLLKTESKYNQFLHHALAIAHDSYRLETAKHSTTDMLSHHLFSISGYIPVDKQQEVEALCQKTDVFMDEVEMDANEVMPTYLENKGLGRIGEDLVGIYDTPSATDNDPSLWVLVFFVVFFSMIVADAGYGLVFLAIAFYTKYKYPDLKGMGYRVWKLLAILSCGCIFWGIALSSFFGISLHSQNPLRKVSIMNYMVEKKAEYHFTRKDDVYDEFIKSHPQLTKVNDYQEFLHEAKNESGTEFPMYSKFTDNILFELALFIGVVHIIFSLLRYANRNWSAIGWIIFMVGAYLYLPSYLNATSFVNFIFGIPKSFGAENGVYLMIGGFSLATILALIQHRIKGALEPMNLIQIFADTMSYLRIYALSLAGAMVAATINEFAAGTAFVIGALLFVVGHAVNIVLSIMGGVIHGLRLIFIEWYHYSFEGGGKKFDPLNLIEKDKE